MEKTTRRKAGTLRNLSAQELENFVGHHMMSRKLLESDVEKGTMVDVLNGQEIPVKTKNGTVMIKDARVVQPGLKATNGELHLIDKVLMPDNIEVPQ